MITHILVPTDFSGPADAALDYARTLAATFGSRLTLLHVVEAPFVPEPELFCAETMAAESGVFQEAKARLTSRVPSADRQRGRVSVVVVPGRSARTILDYAEERGVDLIVMGTHGRSGIAHLLMGSVAETVVRHAPCPVLTVRQPASRLGQPEFIDAVPDLIAIDA